MIIYYVSCADELIIYDGAISRRILRSLASCHRLMFTPTTHIRFVCLILIWWKLPLLKMKFIDRSMSHCLLNIFLTFWDCSFWFRFLVMPFRWFENVLSEIKRSLTMLHFSMHNLFAGYCNCSLFHKCRFYTCCMSSNFTSFMGRRIGALASLLFACRYSSW